MFHSQNYYSQYDTYRETTGKSYIRILHASPDAPSVDIYANDKLIAQNLSYRNFTPYINVDSGNYSLRVFPTGKKNNPVLESNFFIPPRSIFTVAAAGRLANLSLLAVPEPVMKMIPNKAMVRFAHLSPDAPNVDITLPRGQKLFSDVGFKEFTDYIPITPGKSVIQARVAGTNRVVLNVPNIDFTPGKFYTIYAIGFAGGKPGLQVLIPLDGNSYLKF